AKRSEFPRFNFVSDSTLLEILSLGSDPTAVIPHFQSGLFDAISNVTFDKNNPTQIVEMHSREGEVVPMATPVDTKGNVEVWLQKLVLGMQESVHHQAALRASSKEKNAMTRALRSAEATLRELVTLTLRQDLTPIQRTSLETCITVQLHLKETVEDLVRKKIHDVMDFEWLKHARFYWHQDLNTVVISICDVDFEYSYEYLGVKERLVITPLTDVCYITLSQALGMFMGGAPAGPAGTGKTETTKDLGNTLGKYVVVFNCSNQMDNKAMGKIFKGLAQSGLWGCFDEFNRINLDVLSVCAQQLHCILTALRERKKSFVFTDGSTVSLDLRAGYFITMNPGYAGRQELPENLKALFRGVTMMVPDRQIIMKVKLAACGYQESDTLARKFYTLYMLCEQQLSKQAHYDFGLRNILSVLRTAGASKRASPERSETQLLMRTLRDLNMSKLVADDLPIFLGLVEDVFPSQKVERASFLTLQEALLQVIKERGLQAHPTWLDKCVQLYEVNAVRHGIMVVGPSCTGKSTMIACLAAALTLMGTKTVVWKMNPKATTAAQMFGRLDTATGDWTDGVFSTLWRRAARARNQSTWIVLDGPVDALWIENLNTVLDDNRVLTLANGDRIPMTPNMKLFFEVENLNNASPATVSRAGIVYVSASDLGWKPVADSWLQTQLPNVDAGLRPLFAQHVEDLLQFVALQTKPLMRTEAVCLVRTMLVLLSGLLPRAEDATPRGGMRARAGDGAMQSTARPVLAPTPRLGSGHLEKVFAFALAWSVGGLLDEQDRPRFHAELEKRGLPVPSSVPSSKRGPERPVPSAHSSRAAALSPLKPPAPLNPSAPLTIYDCVVSERGEWQPWADLVPDWTYPRQYGDLPLDLSTLSLPTVDSVRYAHLLALAHRAGCPALLVGNPGTAKTWMVKQYLGQGSPTLRASPAPAQRTLTFSHLTSPGILQTALEGSLEKQQGRNYGPPGGGCMTIFFDDLAQPAVNEWGDQVTNELVRQILEQQGFYSLAKPIGDMKMLVDIQYVAAIRTPGVGWNDIPNRLKGRFAAFGVAPPSSATMDAIFGRLLAGRFGPEGDGLSPLSRVSRSLIPATVAVWREAQAKLQPGPNKPHYAFSLHDLARLFQGVVQADLKSLRELKELEPAGEQPAGGRPETASAGAPQVVVPAALGGAASLLALWRHECLRVFGDK
ncbi:hydrolytic ATP binding site of dynein motor region D1, partial [Helicosporidium sp. ATCC 50920]